MKERERERERDLPKAITSGLYGGYTICNVAVIIIVVVVANMPMTTIAMPTKNHAFIYLFVYYHFIKIETNNKYLIYPSDLWLKQ